MKSAECEKLKNELRALAAGRGDGIDIEGEYRWVLTEANNPTLFFRSLHLILPPDSVLYFEGGIITPEVPKFYESHKAPNPVAVIRDTIYPVPETFHVGFTPEVVAGICGFLVDHQLSDLFDHVKAYKGNTLIIAFHDAFSNDCVISGDVTESAVKDFASSAGATYRHELNDNKRNKEDLRHFRNILENPRKLRISGEPWWQRFWRRWGR